MPTHVPAGVRSRAAWLPCFVQVGVALLFTATPSEIFMTAIISSDIVFEVEAYKYKAIAQL